MCNHVNKIDNKNAIIEFKSIPDIPGAIRRWAACAPFKSSPATYATCCKQHANAAVPKPAAGFRTSAVKPVTARPTGQVKRVDSLTDSWTPAVKGLGNLVRGGCTDNSCPSGFFCNINSKCAPTLGKIRSSPSKPTQSGGGGNQKKSGGGGDSNRGSGDLLFNVTHKDSGCGDTNECDRLQYGRHYNGPTSNLQARIKIPETFKVRDSVTLQIGGSQHSNGCNVNGYKGYIGINGDANGIGIEYGEPGAKKNYAPLPNVQCSNITIRPGETRDFKATKVNNPDGVSVTVTTYMDNKPVCTVVDKGNAYGKPFTTRQGKCNLPIDQVRIDNWPINNCNDSRAYVFGVTSGPA